MRREVCFLIGDGEQVLWADASDSPTALPDSRARWEAIWSHRDELAEIAHSHPNGPEQFSQEDEETMAALASALGKVPRFFTINSILRRHLHFERLVRFVVGHVGD